MRRRRPKKITDTYLRRVLSWYLERYDGPRGHIRRLMVQRVDRAVAEHDQDRATCLELLDTVLDDFVRMGLIDDRRWGENSVRTWRQRGASTRQIRSRLMAKGVASALITELIREETGDPERLAALRYARKRRFGPWRTVELDHDRRRKELASLARRGFSYDLARRIIDSEADPAELEDELWSAR